MSKQISIDKKVLQAVFDIAIESMDFGSGFLDDEEVEQLRACAVTLGVDPWKATPENHEPKYCPGHEWGEVHKPTYLFVHNSAYRRCKICGDRKFEDA